MQRNLFLVIGCVGLLAIPGTAHAAIVSYDSGVLPATGQSGAADPVSQGFTWTTNVSNAYAAGFDSGNGGWRVVDGTGSGYAYYQQALSDPGLLSDKWLLTWTVSMDSDAHSSTGGFVDNYYLPPNNGRQNDQVVWLETVLGDTLILTHKADASGNLLIDDGTTVHQITSDGSGYDNFITLTVAHDGSGNYSLGNGTSVFSLATSATHATNRFLFGASSSGGQGSLIWNRIELSVVPEPTSVALLVSGGLLLGLAAWRKRRRKA